MKRVLRTTLLVMAMGVVAAAMAFAQVPRTISFQGVLADAQGILLPDGTYTLTLSIYDVATGGTAVFSESQTNVQVFRGVFNVIIGATSPTGIPAGVDFNSQYWLGVQVNNGTELAPRTQFTSVPYALNAAVAQTALHANVADTATYALRALAADQSILADTAIDVRGGFVRSVNGQQGPVEILGAGATTITRNGNQFIIRSTDTSGGGIQRIDNFDGSLVVDPPQGPYVTLFIRAEGVQTYHLSNLSITTEKIADQAVTNAKLAPNSVTTDKIMDGQVMTPDIADLNVTNEKIGPDAVTTDKIMDGQVMTADIADLNVTNEKIGPDAVTTDKIMDGQVFTQDIANGTILTEDIGDNQVTRAKIGTEGAPLGAFLQSDGTPTPFWSTDGQYITNINASNITHGTLDDARLSPNVPLKNTPNTFTEMNTFNNGVTVNRYNATALDVWTDFNAAGGTLSTYRWIDAGFPWMTTEIGGKRYGAAFDWLKTTMGGSTLWGIRSEWTPAVWYTAMDVNVDTTIFSKHVKFNGPVYWAGPINVTGRPSYFGDITDNLQLFVRGPGAGATTNQFVVDGRAQVNGRMTAGMFAGDGQLITNMNASALTHGVVPNGRIAGVYSDQVQFTNWGNLFRGTFEGTGYGDWYGNLYGGDVYANYINASYGYFSGLDVGYLNAYSYISSPDVYASYISSGYLWSSTIDAYQIYGQDFYGGYFYGDGWNLYNLNASNLSGGTVPNGRLSGTYSNPLYFTNPANTYAGTFSGTFSGSFSGTFSGTFSGNGSGLTNLNASQLTTGTVPDGRIGGTYNNAVNFTNGGNVFAGTFNGTHTGNGAALTSLNASNISSGTLADARLSSNVALKNAANVFTDLNTFNNGIVVNRSVSGANALNVFTNYNASGGEQSVFHWTDLGFGDLGTVIGGKRYGAAFDWLRSYNGATNLFWIHSEWTPSEWYTAFDVTTDYAKFDAQVTFNDLVTINSTLTATAFAGNGAGLTNLNASNISTGTLADARLSANVPLKNAANNFTGANTFGNAGNSFTGDGAGLTNLNASNIATGSLALARISTAGAAANQSVMYNGANVVWGSPSASALTMPFSQTASEATTMFSLTNTDAAAGRVATFYSTNAANTGTVFEARSDGLGTAAFIRTENAASTVPALRVTTTSTVAGGNAALFNGPVGAIAPTLASYSNGTGQAIAAMSTVGYALAGYASSSGTGVFATSSTGTAANFTITNAANASTALAVTTAGAGTGISSIATSGVGVAGTSTSGAGVSGTSTSGSGVSAISSSGNAINASSTSGIGVNASSSNSTGLAAATGSATQYAGTFTGNVNGSNGIQINAGVGGVAINMVRGAFIGSYGAFAGGATIPNDVMVVHVADDGVGGSSPTVTLPTGVDGQMLILSTADPDGANFGPFLISNAFAYRIVKVAGAWKREW